MPENEVGSIMLWQGSKETIPDSWSLCDGTQGTPDLRNAFLYGNSVGTPPIVTGGEFTHNHDFATDGHIHIYPAGTDLPSGGGISSSTNSNVIAGTSDSDSQMPPWYSLCYIMYIGES
ncbi:hypothetical protein KAR91_84860 [Candidatus Pacearchaeota archaeon]|nr:hypothetical protein [Candidatus Pacearchaeota archaeon]